jgi:UDP-N-acetylglucosamine:LPS N-acetylglucosamine transferase
MKICLVCSSGGHLLQLHLLEEWWGKYERFWVTFEKEDAIYLLREEKSYWGYFPTNRSLKNLIKNTFLAFKIIRKERPNIIVSTGAGISVPFFYVGKLYGAKCVFIEVYDRIDSPTLTGKLNYPVADAYILQWDEQKKYYPKGVVLGQLL